MLSFRLQTSVVYGIRTLSTQFTMPNWHFTSIERELFDTTIHTMRNLLDCGLLK